MSEPTPGVFEQKNVRSQAKVYRGDDLNEGLRLIAKETATFREAHTFPKGGRLHSEFRILNFTELPAGTDIFALINLGAEEVSQENIDYMLEGAEERS